MRGGGKGDNADAPSVVVLGRPEWRPAGLEVCTQTSSCLGTTATVGGSVVAAAVACAWPGHGDCSGRRLAGGSAQLATPSQYAEEHSMYRHS